MGSLVEPLVLVGATFLILTPLVALVWLWRPYTVSKSVPGPVQYPLIGVLWFALKNWTNWPKVCCKTSTEFNHSTWGGPCFRYGAVFYTDAPSNVRHILRDNFANYEKGKVWRSIFREVLGNGIFNTDGELWASHRKISAKLFSRNLLKFSCKAVDRNCRLIVRQFDEAIHDKGGEYTTVDLQDLFQRLTMDNTAETTFGFQLESLKAKQQPFFTSAFDELQGLCLARVVDPFFEIKRMLQLTRDERRIRLLQKKLRAFCADIVRNKRQAVENDESRNHEDLLSLFLRYGSHKSENEQIEELIDVMLNFMVAGRDTTAAGLSWTFYELSKRPDIVDKIIVEASEVFGPPDKAEYTFEGLNKLRYTHCVLMEALRLHPPVPVDSKFAIRDDTLPDGTFIPARSLVTYLPYSMGRNENIYGSDMKEFNPERFLNQNEPSPFSFSVFNAGPRLCLGKPLALLTMKMVLVQLLPRFEFRDELGHTDAIQWNLVGKMKHGFTVNISRH